MRVRFLLGPAGSGKTFRCLEEIRAGLRRDPGGAPLILLAPKQATYQLERQLLADPTLAGYARLRILSFERLADFAFEQAPRPPHELLDEEGRVMVLRALLGSRKQDLKVFGTSSRQPGFARQLSGVLRELQQHRLSPEPLLALQAKVGAANRLNDKLQDLALLLQDYLAWLDDHGLQDGDRWLDLAAEAWQQRSTTSDRDPSEPPWIEGLWLDGFAQMTPQERGLLMALLPHCREATLAFCLEHEPAAEPAWYSQWSLLAQTFRQCQNDVAAFPQAQVEIVTLPRRAQDGRFQGHADLAYLESHWANPQPQPAAPDEAALPSDTSVRIVRCPDRDAEAALAAREILEHVQAGGRFREVGVQVRSLEPYHACIRRVFSRYEIPFFLDRRENVAHHPLAELTRNALRTLAFGWKHDDWFAALKSGLLKPYDDEIDWLENEALARGWEGRAWLSPFREASGSEQPPKAEALRAALIRPFAQLAQTLGSTPSGRDLGEGLRAFWKAWRVEQTLQDWGHGLRNDPAALSAARSPTEVTQPLHETVWDQMRLWLENVARAFPVEPLALTDWLPILEAGLSGLTVGVVPPVLDQVLVGSIDRSRNPDLRRTIVLGWNETIFPAPPPLPLLLTQTDRDRLDDLGHGLGSTARIQLGHERFYGYIACTRARERLVLTYAQRDGSGKPLNPSPFLRHVQKLLPQVTEETFTGSASWAEARHFHELIPALLRQDPGPLDPPEAVRNRLTHHPKLAPILDRLRHWHTSSAPVTLDPALADRLYGPQLVTSVSRIEDFASCPFRFFVRSGLRVEERLRYELDIRQQGSFQHEVLSRFHESLAAEKRPWRSLTPEDAQTRVANIADELLPTFQDGMLVANARNHFLAQNYKQALQQFIAVIIEWMKQYRFDPTAVELGFGMKEREPTALPAWELPLAGDRKLAFIGRIDRIDTFHDEDHDQTLCVVIDYKSGQRKVDRVLMEHGIQQQLPAYLNVLRHLREPAPPLGDRPLVPAGVFYVPLRGRFEGGRNRRDVLQDADRARRLAYTHQGFADLSVRPFLDSRRDALQGDQFPYKLTKTGQPYQNNATLLSAAEFLALLDRQEQWLIEAGQRIFAGDVAIDPWKKGRETACDQCEFQSVCRMDPWTHAFRVLPASTA